MTVERTGSVAPRRVTRPRNRRALIIAAATELFYRRGYDHVSMSDIADAVTIGPSALYRHFSGKQHLLRAVIAEGFAPVHELLDNLDLTDRAKATSQLATLAIEHRELGVLWQREARYMSTEDFRALRHDLRDIGTQLTSRIEDARPDLSHPAADLLAWSTSAVIMSTSFHQLNLPRPEYKELMTELVGVVLDTDLPNTFALGPAEPTNGPFLTPSSRREALLARAVRMFARHGYSGVGIEGIGAAVGITGPSIYNHFPSKRDMLVTALRRGTAVLFMGLTSVYASASNAPDALRRLISSYVRFAIEHHDLIDILITETEHLPHDERHAARQAQHDYISEWVHLLRMAHAGLDATAARIRVHAVLSVANGAARTPHLRHNPAVPAALEGVCLRLLRLPRDV